MPRKPLPVEKQHTIVEETKAGTNRPTIAKRVGCSEKTVYKYQVWYGLI